MIVYSYLLHLFLEYATEEGGISADVIKKAFQTTEEGFFQLVKLSMPIRPQIASAGSCCLLGIISNDELHIANLGDSRVVLAQKVLEKRNVICVFTLVVEVG